MIIGSRLKEERLKRGYSQEQLGTLVGVSKVSISNYERGLEQPKMKRLQKLIDVLEISPNYILGKDVDVQVGAAGFMVQLTFAEDCEEYRFKISKMELEIIKQLRQHQNLYRKMCNEPKRTIDLIEMKLKKEKVI